MKRLRSSQMRSGTAARYFICSTPLKGLPEPTQKDRLKDDFLKLGSMAAYKGRLSCPEYMVTTRLKAIDFPPERYVIHKGFIEKISFEKGNVPTRVYGEQGVRPRSAKPGIGTTDQNLHKQKIPGTLRINLWLTSNLIHP